MHIIIVLMPMIMHINVVMQIIVMMHIDAYYYYCYDAYDCAYYCCHAYYCYDAC